MKDRRPRKLKKTLKRRFAKVQVFRTVQVALTALGSAFQIARIQATPIPKADTLLPPELSRVQMTAIQKAKEVISVSMNTAESISKIMNTGPKNWREA